MRFHPLPLPCTATSIGAEGYPEEHQQQANKQLSLSGAARAAMPVDLSDAQPLGLARCRFRNRTCDHVTVKMEKGSVHALKR